MKLERNDPRHGTVNGYCNLGCRCQRCRVVWTAYCLDRRRRRDPAQAPTHGKESTYLNWNCRCQPCRDAHNKRNRERRVVETAKKRAVRQFLRDLESVM
jgi:hypothetical protein